jgi:hypothetical protein
MRARSETIYAFDKDEYIEVRDLLLIQANGRNTMQKR